MLENPILAAFHFAAMATGIPWIEANLTFGPPQARVSTKPTEEEIEEREQREKELDDHTTTVIRIVVGGREVAASSMVKRDGNASFPEPRADNGIEPTPPLLLAFEERGFVWH